jgi:hypothetical protein
MFLYFWGCFCIICLLMWGCVHMILRGGLWDVGVRSLQGFCSCCNPDQKKKISSHDWISVWVVMEVCCPRPIIFSPVLLIWKWQVGDKMLPTNWWGEWFLMKITPRMVNVKRLQVRWITNALCESLGEWCGDMRNYRMARKSADGRRVRIILSTRKWLIGAQFWRL